MDKFTKEEIRSDADRITKIISFGIFEPKNAGHPLLRSALTELLICLRDLLAKAECYGTRVSFKEDVNITPLIPDVTESIAWARDAACHVDSFKRRIEAEGIIVSAFNVVYGKGKFFSFGPHELASDYEDDVCFFMGAQRLYLQRHLIRAFNEAMSQLNNFL